MDLPTITVAALGRRSLAWLPTREEPAVVLAPELEERRRAFVRYIEDKLQHDDDDDDENPPAKLKVSRLPNTSVRHAALVVASDPALAGFFLGPLRDNERNLDGPRLAAWLRSRFADLENKLGGLLSPWTETNEQNCPRPTSDKKVQSAVRAWYGNQCFLTGVDRTDGAHIVPVRVTSRN